MVADATGMTSMPLLLALSTRLVYRIVSVPDQARTAHDVHDAMVAAAEAR